MMQYELSKQKFIKKTIDDADIEVMVNPRIKEIDNLRKKEAELLQEINEKVQQFNNLVNGIDDEGY